MKVATIGVLLALLTLTLAPPASAGASEDAALALGAFAVFNQLIRGDTILHDVLGRRDRVIVYSPPPVVYAPPPPPAIIYAPPPPPPAVRYPHGTWVLRHGYWTWIPKKKFKYKYEYEYEVD